MTKKPQNIRGNAAPIILLAVSVIALAIGGWVYFTRMAPQGDNTDAAMIGAALENDPSAATVPESEPLVSQMPVAEDAPPPSETVATDDTSSAATIDVAKAMSPRTIGNENAPIKIIEYASLTCSHCAHFHNDVLPALKTKYIDTGKVFMEFREFPLNDPALKATLTARCLPEDKYESFVSMLFKTQEQWSGGLDYVASLKQNAKLAGMSDEMFDACHKEPMLKLQIAEKMQEAQDKWKISATPTFIINDGAETISGAQPLEAFERIFSKLTNDAVGAAPAVE